MKICEQCNTFKESIFCSTSNCIRNTEYKLNLYNKQFNYNMNNFKEIIHDIIPTLEKCTGTIYITGIGKSAHISKKNVSTWQSLGIKTQNILIQDIFHGDIGIIQNGDIIIYISHSGNTKELIDLAKYIKIHYNIVQISFSNNNNNDLALYVNKTYGISKNKIDEADILSLVPSVSSMLYLSLFDIIGIELSELKGFSKELFLLNHPKGAIGDSLKKI
jgi:arabinose-5-phosphate isomerase